jgi:hypothetical protein
MRETMTDDLTPEERGWFEGRKAAYRDILGEAISVLGREGATEEVLIAELEDVRRTLRTLCKEFGDDDWDDKLHLGDVLEKHLGRHLRRGNYRDMYEREVERREKAEEMWNTTQQGHESLLKMLLDSQNIGRKFEGSLVESLLNQVNSLYESALGNGEWTEELPRKSGWYRWQAEAGANPEVVELEWHPDVSGYPDGRALIYLTRDEKSYWADPGKPHGRWWTDPVRMPQPEEWEKIDEEGKK